jgi:hypothetical protein
MTSDDEKDPPVPAHLEGAPMRIHRKHVEEESDATDHKVHADDAND